MVIQPVPPRGGGGSGVKLPRARTKKGGPEEIKGPGWSQSTKLNADFLLLE